MRLFKWREWVKLFVDTRLSTFFNSNIKHIEDEVRDMRDYLFDVKWIGTYKADYMPRYQMELKHMQNKLDARSDTIKHLEERVVLLNQGHDELLYALRAWMKETDGYEERLYRLESIVAEMVRENGPAAPVRIQGAECHGTGPCGSAEMDVQSPQENDEDARS